MNRKKALVLFGLALAAAFFLKERYRSPEPLSIQDTVAERAASPVPASAPVAAPLVAAVESSADAGGAVESEEKRDLPPRSYFPKAKVVARVREQPQADGRFREWETIETSMKEKYVRVERTFLPDANGKLQTVAEAAMVANQVLLMKPAELEVARFEEILRQAGAIDLKPVGAAFLATFPARPQDPRALETYIARVKELAQVDFPVEPNYLRKMF